MVPAAFSSLRIVLIDDHALVRAGLRMLIESRHEWHVVGEPANRQEALTAVTHAQPDIIVLDLDLGKSSGLDFLAEVFTTAPRRVSSS